MLAYLHSRITLVWAVLVTATFGSWWLGTGSDSGDETAAGLTVLALAFVKVRLVGLYFMELRDAPLPLRVMFEGWVLVVCGVVAGLYLSG